MKPCYQAYHAARHQRYPPRPRALSPSWNINEWNNEGNINISINGSLSRANPSISPLPACTLRRHHFEPTRFLAQCTAVVVRRSRRSALSHSSMSIIKLLVVSLSLWESLNFTRFQTPCLPIAPMGGECLDHFYSFTTMSNRGYRTGLFDQESNVVWG